MNQNIVVIGSSNVDFIMKMERLPEKGETITDALFMQTFGGKGANQAVGAAKAGGEVWFVNCVGDDAFAPLLLENMRQAGVHVDYVRAESGIASGAALVMVGGAGQNYLSVAPVCKPWRASLIFSSKSKTCSTFNSQKESSHVSPPPHSSF